MLLCSLLVSLLASCGPSRMYRIPVEKEPAPAFHKPISKGHIVIDAGHGGKDNGAQSLTKPLFLEKNLNLTTALMLSSILQDLGYKTSFTRETDLFVPLKERASMANDLKPTLFVSVHYNSAPNQKAEGIEVYFYRSETDVKRSQTSERLAKDVHDQLIKFTAAKSRGIKHGNLAVIRETNIPAVLVEGGFLSNEKEMEKLRDAMYLKKVALGIALGIHKHLHANEMDIALSRK